METLRLSCPGSILTPQNPQKRYTNPHTANSRAQISLKNTFTSKICVPRAKICRNSYAAQNVSSVGVFPSKSPSKIRRAVVVKASLIGENPEWFESDYIAVGLAHCFNTINEKLHAFFVIEPIPASGLECMYNGGTTSYKYVVGSTLGVVLKEDVNLLPEEFRIGVFAEKFERRAKAASRTWKREYPQGHLMHLAPIGVVKGGFNFSLEDKRLLGVAHEVKDEDNIKQDLSIDVYGRKKKESQEEKKDEESLISSLYNV